MKKRRLYVAIKTNFGREFQSVEIIDVNSLVLIVFKLIVKGVAVLKIVCFVQMMLQGQLLILASQNKSHDKKGKSRYDSTRKSSALVDAGAGSHNSQSDSMPLNCIQGGKRMLGAPCRHIRDCDQNEPYIGWEFNGREKSSHLEQKAQLIYEAAQK